MGDVPFAVLAPVDLAPQAKRDNLLPDVNSAHVSSRFADAATIVMLDSQMMWVIGNVGGLANKAETFSARIRTPAPLMSFSATLPEQSDEIAIPSTLEEWADAQQSDPDFEGSLPAPQFVTIQQPHGLQLYSTEGSTPKILVPPRSREALVRKVHHDMHHLGAVKVHRALQQSYFWPTMRADCRQWLENCPECELQKATRNEAHALFSAMPYVAPRSRWCMDFQGMGKALTGEMEVLALSILLHVSLLCVHCMVGRQTCSFLHFWITLFLNMAFLMCYILAALLNFSRALLKSLLTRPTSLALLPWAAAPKAALKWKCGGGIGIVACDFYQTPITHAGRASLNVLHFAIMLLLTHHLEVFLPLNFSMEFLPTTLTLLAPLSRNSRRSYLTCL